MSRDAEIMDALQTRLETIRTIGGYQTNIGQRVFIHRAYELGQNELPAILAEDIDIEHDYSAVMGMTRNTMTVHLTVVQSGIGSLAEARKARADMKKCLHGYETVGGNANSLKVIKSSILMKQYEKLTAGSMLTVIVEYDTSRDAI